MDKKEYMKKYYLEHKEEYRKRAEKYLENHPDYKKEYYQNNKEMFNNNLKRWINKSEENRKRFTESCNRSRKKRIEKLRAEGVINVWAVLNKKAEPIYEEK